jgi:hypothetical protein
MDDTRDGLTRIEAVAEGVIRRDCGFAGLAIMCVMVGLSFDPVLCFKSGAVLTTLMGVVLAMQAWRAPNRPYRRTQLWIALDKRHGLPEQHAQRVIGTALRELYVRYAELTGATALALWATAFVLLLLGA